MRNNPSPYSLILFFFLILRLTSGMGQGASVAPSRIFFSTPPGHTHSHLVALDNTGNTPLVFNVSVKDWQRDSLGNKVYYKAGSLPASNSSWLEVTPGTVVVPPRSRKTINVTMHMPDTGSRAPGVTNSMLFFTQVEQQQPIIFRNKGGVGVHIRLEFGVHIYNTPPGLRRKDLDITAFKELPDRENSGSRNIALKVSNTGEVVTDAWLRFEMTDRVTGEEMTISPVSLSILPSAEQVVHLSLPPGIRGKFLLVAILDSGDHSPLKVAEKDVTYE
jgi:P pilus assembly chaperone PapD